MPIDKAKLGIRYTCFQCAAKFYDLNRPEPICPTSSPKKRGRGSRRRWGQR